MRNFKDYIRKMITPITKSLSRRILSVFFIAVIPIYTIGIELYIASREQLVEEAMTIKCSQMEYYINSMQDEIVRVAQLCATVMNKPTIAKVNNSYSYLSNYRKGVEVNALRSDLSAITMSSRYISTVTAYMLGCNRMLNDHRGFEQMTENDLDMALRLNASIGQYFYCLDDDFYIVTALRDSKFQASYLIAAQIDVNVFISELAELRSSIPSEIVLKYCPGDFFITGESTQLRKMCSEVDAVIESNQIKDGQIIKLEISNKKHRVACVDSNYLGLRLYSFTTETDLFASASKYSFYLFTIIATAIALSVLLLVSVYSMVHKPLRYMAKAFKQVEMGDLTVRIQHNRCDEFRELYSAFNQMTEKLDSYINRSLQQEIALNRSEVLQLQSQINPHFLYNSYFMLHRMVKCRDWESAELLSQYMGEYFRNITRNEKQFVMLRQEVAHARNYTEIQKMRFGGRITVDFPELPSTVADISTPKLILQPLIENAFEHGLKDAIADGIVRVRFEAIPNGCIISVEDNGYDMSDEQIAALQESLLDIEGEITALRNINRRLMLIMPECGGLRLSRSVLGGLKVEINIVENKEASDC